MKKEKTLFHAITDLPDEQVEEARATKLKRANWRRWTALAAAAALVIGIGAFAGRGGGQNGTPDTAPLGRALMEVIFPQACAFDDYDARRAARDDNPVEEEFLTAVNEFSYETAAEALTGTANGNYSPLSLYYALALAASGAEGETAAELFDLLGVDDAAQLSEQCGNLYRRLYTDNEIGQLKIANSLWMDQDVIWKDTYVKNAAEQFYASVYSVDFAAPETGGRMAQWVSEQTNGLLVPRFDADPEQILSILNTVYFHDEWTDRFDPAQTAEDTFTRADGSRVTCDFMNRRYASAGFRRGANFTRADLGLKNTGRMIFVLPDEGTPVQELLASPEALREVFEGGEEGYGEVTWKIPKFSFSTQMDLKDPLKKLGVTSPFETDADFSKLTDNAAYFSAVRQETRIGIDENGVEAAAFTEIAYCGAGMPQDKAEMILDRPFLYGITAADGTLLFIGVCADPVSP